MIDFIKTYFKYILFHDKNKLSKETFEFLDEHWKSKQTSSSKKWLYDRIKKINGINNL